MTTHPENESIKTIGAIGCGVRLTDIITKTCLADSRVRLVAAYDPWEPSLDYAREQLRTLGLVHDFRSCASVEEVVHAADVDWVFIGSWNSQHKDHILAAAQAGKPIFCEKPLVTNFEDALVVREVVERTGVEFSIGFVLRYSPFYRRIKELLNEGVVGKILSFEFNETIGSGHGGLIMGNWRRLRANAGTHLLEKCCHDFDIANWLVGALPVRAASFGGLDFYTPENAYHIERIGPNKDGIPAYSDNTLTAWKTPHQGLQKNPFTSDKDILDNQVVLLEYGNGARATFHANCNSALPERRFYINGTEGAIRGDVREGVIEWRRIGWDKSLHREKSSSGGHGGGDVVLTASIARTMIEGTPPHAGLYDGLTSAISCFGVDIAQDEQRIVDLRPMWEKANIDPSAFIPSSHDA